jgi:hypothetical protein
LQKLAGKLFLNNTSSLPWLSFVGTIKSWMVKIKNKTPFSLFDKKNIIFILPQFWGGGTRRDMG